MGKTKLTTEQVKELAVIKITAKDEEDARKQLIAYLGENEIEGVDDDSYEELISMATVIFEGSNAELDAAAAEASGEEEEEAETTDEAEDTEEPSLEDMKAKLIASGMKKKEVNELSEKKLIKAFNSLPAPEAKKEEPKKEDKKADKAKKEDKKSEPKKEDKKPADKKSDKKAEPKKDKKPSKKIDPKNNAEDAAKFDGFKAELEKILKGHQVNFSFIANGGLSVRIVGKNSSKVILSFDTPKYDKDEKIVASLFMPTKDEELMRELFGEDAEFKTAWNGALSIVNVSFDDIVTAFKSNKEVLAKLVNSIIKKDEKLGKNREKMEADLKEEKNKKAQDAKAKAGKKEDKKADKAKKEDKKSDKKSDKKKK